METNTRHAARRRSLEITHMTCGDHRDFRLMALEQHVKRTYLPVGAGPQARLAYQAAHGLVDARDHGRASWWD